MHWDGPSNFSIVRGTPKSLQTAGIRSKFRARGAHRDKVIEVVIDHCHPPLEHCPLQRIGNCRENLKTMLNPVQSICGKFPIWVSCQCLLPLVQADGWLSGMR